MNGSHPLFRAPATEDEKRAPNRFDNVRPQTSCTHGLVVATIYEGAAPADVALAAEFLCGEAARLGVPDGVAPGLRQILQWARAYVDGFGNCRADRLSPEERDGLAELERLEKLL